MSEFLLVDSGSLQVLWESFGEATGLKQLLASGRKIVLTGHSLGGGERMRCR